MGVSEEELWEKHSPHEQRLMWVTVEGSGGCNLKRGGHTAWVLPLLKLNNT